MQSQNSSIDSVLPTDSQEPALPLVEMASETLPSILIVDDDLAFAETLARALIQKGHAAEFLLSPVDALAKVRQTSFDALILDLRLGIESGLHFIAPLHAARPAMRILLLTGYASIATAVRAIKLGAAHYLAKPASVAEILAVLGFEAGNVTVAPAEGPMSLERLEWEHIQKILTAHDGNLSATARALKMHRRTLQRKLAKRLVRN